MLASAMFESTIAPDPALALLNLGPDFLQQKQFKLIQLLTAAKQTTAKAWKAPTLHLANTKHGLNQTLHAKMSALDKRSEKV